MRAIAAESSSSSARTSATVNVVDATSSGRSRNWYATSTSVRPGAEAHERVDEPLERVLGLDDLGRRPPVERVRLVVDDDSARTLAPEDVETAADDHAVVLERERALRPRALQTPRSVGRDPSAQYASTSRGDPLELLLGDVRIPAADGLLELARAAEPPDRRAARARAGDEPHRRSRSRRDRSSARPSRRVRGAAARERARRSSGTSSARRARARCTRGGARRGRAAPESRRARAARCRGGARPLGSSSKSASCSSSSSATGVGLGGHLDADRGRVSIDREHEPRVARARARPGVSSASTTVSCASRRSSTQPIGVARSAVRSGSIAPETIRRSIARVIAT